MDKDRFIQVMHHFSESTVEEAQEMLSLKEQFPYSQILHALSAKLTRDHGFSNQGGELQQAAVYAADRAVLKDIMQQEGSWDNEPRALGSSDAPTIAAIPVPVEVKSQVEVKIQPVEEVADSNVAEEILHDLERLHRAKHNFEMMFKTGAETPEVQPVVVDKPVQPIEVVAAVTAPVETAPAIDQVAPIEFAPPEVKKSKRERIIELARALEASRSEQEEVVDEAKPKTRRKRKNEGEELMEEIVSSKQQIEPENEKLKEQIDLIDNFIKIQPSIANSKDKPLPEPGDDLSTTKTGEFGDNIVSETLVEILVKQGKKDRAIEVLKKLIWKFPQKKAYFAAQIEDLKK